MKYPAVEHGLARFDPPSHTKLKVCGPRPERRETPVYQAAGESMPLHCMECDRKFKRKVGRARTRMSGCANYDVEPDYERGFPTGTDAGSRKPRPTMIREGHEPPRCTWTCCTSTSRTRSR